VSLSERVSVFLFSFTTTYRYIIKPTSSEIRNPKHQSTPFGLLLLLLLLLPTALDDTPTTKAQNMVAASAPHCF